MLFPRRHARVGWYRSRVRDKCREALLEANGDGPTATQLANISCANIPSEMKEDRQMQSIILSIALAVLVNLVASWIAEFIKDWAMRGVQVPALSYQKEEPGYEPCFEDDES